MTLAELAQRFLARLEADGKSDATIGAYKADLAVAQRVLGETTLVDDMRPEHVAAFYESDAVLLARNGEPKAEPTFRRTQRVLRLALQFAEDEGWILVAPIPEETAAAN